MNMKTKYFLLALLAVIGMASCSDKDSEGLTRITYYPTIELAGDASMVVQKGSEYVDPGYTSYLNGEDVTDQVTVTSNVDTSKSGVYTVTYTTMSNSDGYNSTASRTVIVLDLNDPVEGFYQTSPSSYREYNGATVAYGSAYEILVIGNGDGTYYFEDLLAGWYCQRAGYGSSYAMTGNVAVGDDGTLTLVDSYLSGWGDSLESLEGTFDTATSTFNYVAEYTSYKMLFHVTMTKE